MLNPLDLKYRSRGFFIKRKQFNGHFLQIRDLPLDGLDGLDLIHGLDVHTDDEGAFHVEEVRQHPVVQLWR